jgi:UPF0755 protein
MARIALRIIYVLLVLGVVLGGALGWGYAQFVRPGPLKAPAVVIVPRGTGVEGIAAELARGAVIFDAMVFRLGVRLTRADTALRAGEYAFPAGISAREVVALLKSGKTVVRRVTVAEGLTASQIVARLDTTDGLNGAIEKVPGEGTLLPETYHFSFGDRRKAMISRMTDAMDATLEDLWEGRATGLPLKTPMEALILASIVEKETGRSDERARIAGVFVNRLRKGMRLQSDPTVAYGLSSDGKPLGRPLTRADLKTPTPYNTYLIERLPPSPICNPGRASIAAVLGPAATDELFFVAAGSGGHAFARTLKEHNRNVARWRKIQKQRRKTK